MDTLLARLGFSGPLPGDPGIPKLDQGGVYVTLSGDQVLYVGETSSFADSPVGPAHERYSDWTDAAGEADSIALCFLVLPDPRERRILERMLLEFYGPPCKPASATGPTYGFFTQGTGTGPRSK
jgi:hypothetical protein